jgi:hypothetical protein
MREATTNARVHIWSHFAAGYNDHRADMIEGGADPASLDPVRNEVWQGLIPQMTLEEIFRFFNRVEDADVERLKGIGFDLPSLSSGDIVTVDGTQWRVAAVGFEEIHKPVEFEMLARFHEAGWRIADDGDPYRPDEVPEARS